MSKVSGKHNPDDVLIGFLDAPEIRALTELVTEKDGIKTVSDFFRKHIFDRAEAHGIMRDGVAVGQWRVLIAARAEAIRTARKRRSAARKATATKKEDKQ